ncbi:hypothetical protein HDU96_009301 [Phlyctochytrium bullatum]|nr:hypothetical protein HDU96_009301 [Phlyctochytrium bullatum]
MTSSSPFKAWTFALSSFHQSHLPQHPHRQPRRSSADATPPDSYDPKQPSPAFHAFPTPDPRLYPVLPSVVPIPGLGITATAAPPSNPLLWPSHPSLPPPPPPHPSLPPPPPSLFLPAPPPGAVLTSPTQHYRPSPLRRCVSAPTLDKTAAAKRSPSAPALAKLGSTTTPTATTPDAVDAPEEEPLGLTFAAKPRLRLSRPVSASAETIFEDEETDVAPPPPPPLPRNPVTPSTPRVTFQDPVVVDAPNDEDDDDSDACSATSSELDDNRPLAALLLAAAQVPPAPGNGRGAALQKPTRLIRNHPPSPPPASRRNLKREVSLRRQLSAQSLRKAMEGEEGTRGRAKVTAPTVKPRVADDVPLGLGIVDVAPVRRVEEEGEAEVRAARRIRFAGVPEPTVAKRRRSRGEEVRTSEDVPLATWMETKMGAPVPPSGLSAVPRLSPTASTSTKKPPRPFRWSAPPTAPPPTPLRRPPHTPTSPPPSTPKPPSCAASSTSTGSSTSSGSASSSSTLEDPATTQQQQPAIIKPLVLPDAAVPPSPEVPPGAGAAMLAPRKPRRSEGWTTDEESDDDAATLRRLSSAASRSPNWVAPPPPQPQTPAPAASAAGEPAAGRAFWRRARSTSRRRGGDAAAKDGREPDVAVVSTSEEPRPASGFWAPRRARSTSRRRAEDAAAEEADPGVAQEKQRPGSGFWGLRRTRSVTQKPVENEAEEVVGDSAAPVAVAAEEPRPVSGFWGARRARSVTRKPATEGVEDGTAVVAEAKRGAGLWRRRGSVGAATAGPSEEATVFWGGLGGRRRGLSVSVSAPTSPVMENEAMGGDGSGGGWVPRVRARSRTREAPRRLEWAFGDLAMEEEAMVRDADHVLFLGERGAWGGMGESKVVARRALGPEGGAGGAGMGRVGAFAGWMRRHGGAEEERGRKGRR